MYTIGITDLTLTAFIGIHESEQHNLNTIRIQAELMVNAELEGNDEAAPAVNYETAAHCMEKVFSKKIRLLETAAAMILDSLRKTFPAISEINLKVEKLNPPMSASAGAAYIHVHWKRTA
jgi:dihydroneopterin aldolase